MEKLSKSNYKEVLKGNYIRQQFQQTRISSNRQFQTGDITDRQMASSGSAEFKIKWLKYHKL